MMKNVLSIPASLRSYPHPVAAASGVAHTAWRLVVELIPEVVELILDVVELIPEAVELIPEAVELIPEITELILTMQEDPDQ